MLSSNVSEAQCRDDEFFFRVAIHFNLEGVYTQYWSMSHFLKHTHGNRVVNSLIVLSHVGDYIGL